MLSRRWLQFRIASLFGVVTIIAICLGIGPQIYAYINVRFLSNNDLRVDGTPLGLSVILNTSSAKRLRWLGKKANPSLLSAMRDPNRFAAAHVLLSEINLREQQLSSAEWNHMRIDLYADGTVDLHPRQAEKLERYWKETLGVCQP